MEHEDKQQCLAQIDTALAYTLELLEKLQSQDDSQAVINVSKSFLKRACAMVSLGVEASHQHYPDQSYSIKLWQEHFFALTEILEEGWDVLALKKELRALKKALIMIKKMRERKPEPVNRYLFFRKGNSAMQEAALARENLTLAKEKNQTDLCEKAKKQFHSALRKALYIPYEGSRVKAVIDVVDQSAKVDKQLCKELIETIDLNQPLCRDSAVLAALTSFEYSQMKEAVSLTQLLFKQENKDRALQFLFDLCCEQDIEMASKLIRKVTDSRLRYRLLAQLASIATKKDLKKAQSLCSMIADETIREKVQLLIEQCQWQSYLRRKSQKLEQRQEEKKAVMRKTLKG